MTADERLAKALADQERRLAQIEKHGSIPARHIRRQQLIAYAAVVVLTVLGIYFIGHQQDQLRDGLIHSCEVNSNPLRGAVRKQIQLQLIQQKTFNYGKFFPNIPPRRLNQLIGKQIKQEHRELASIPPVDCEAIY